MNIKVAICDDNQSDMDTLSEYMTIFCSQNNVFFSIDHFTSGRELIKAHEKIHFDIIFLDIEMPEMSGLCTAQLLRDSGYDNVIMIFVSSYPEYMQDSFEVQPFQFISKPISEEKTLHVLTKVIDRYKSSHVIRMIADNLGRNRLINLSDIVYIQNIKGEKRLLRYRLVNDEFLGRGTISDWEDALSQDGFVAPCRGFLVNMKHVLSFDRENITLDNNEAIPVSRRKHNQMQLMYANSIINILD